MNKWIFGFFFPYLGGFFPYFWVDTHLKTGDLTRQEIQIPPKNQQIMKDSSEPKKKLILSMKYWLFNRDPYVMVYYNLYIPG